MAHDDRMPPLSTGRVLRHALALRCPVCGGGGLFPRWFDMVERCPTCGFRFHRVEGHWVGSLGINTVLSFGALLLTVVIGFAATYPDPPVAILVIVAIAVAGITPLVLFPWSRTIWSGIDLLMSPLGPDDEVDPRWWPSPKRRRR